MTPSQLEHLKLIDAHLERLLAITEKRTPGEWKSEGRFVMSDAPTVRLAALAEVRDSLAGCRPSLIGDTDAAFIASCAGNAEAGWEYCKDQLQRWRNTWEFARTLEMKNVAEQELESILAAFPIELIHKP